MINRPRSVSRVLVLAAAAAVTTLAIGVSAASNGLFASAKKAAAPTTWTTVLKSPLAIEGLTGDDAGNLYVAARGGGAACPVFRVDSAGDANQTPVTVGTVAPPCGPAGITFDATGRLYITGAGAAGDEIAVLSPNAAVPPVATIFATGMPGANGLAFDRHGNLYASDGGTAQGRVFRVGSQGGAATELFRVPPMTNSVGVGRQNASLPPGGAQNIVANGLAFTQDGALLIADTARGALWRVEFDQDGNVVSPVGCDTTFTAKTLCFENLFVAHPALEGNDGIALDRAGNVWADANERNAIVVVDRQGRVSEFFRNPVDAAAGNLRNQGPLEFPTSPFLTDRTLCTTSSDGNRRDNSPNSGGEVGPGTGFAGKISCADEWLQVPGLPLPVH
jgi:SMP-30/Gluconolactonase/LRE-like region